MVGEKATEFSCGSIDASGEGIKGVLGVEKKDSGKLSMRVCASAIFSLSPAVGLGGSGTFLQQPFIPPVWIEPAESACNGFAQQCLAWADVA